MAISVPGAHAAAVAEEALAAGRHVFLYSDNVPVEREVALKRTAAARGLLLLGPDCGTARIGGVGLGFANRVRRGGIGLVGASGTGLQVVSCRIDALAAAEPNGEPIGEGRIGVSQIVGTGGRDLSEQVGATATLQALDLLARDAATEVVVLVSKPPAPAVAARVLEHAGRMGKPVVVCLVGDGQDEEGGAAVASNVDRVHGLEAAAERAVARMDPALRQAQGGSVVGTDQAEGGSEVGTVQAEGGSEVGTDPIQSAPLVLEPPSPEPVEGRGTDLAPRDLRGLFCGGTLALEAAVALRDRLSPLSTNLGLPGTRPLADPERSEGHTLVDLGADELTRGKPHPMIDPAGRDQRLRREAADPRTAVLLVDVVLGDGAHPDPAAGLAPAVEAALAAARRDGRALEVVALVVGCAGDPQGIDGQMERLRRAGARVTRSLAAAVGYAAAAISQAREAADGEGRAAAEAAQPPTAVAVGAERSGRGGDRRPRRRAAGAADGPRAAGGDQRRSRPLRRQRRRPGGRGGRRWTGGRRPAATSGWPRSSNG